MIALVLALAVGFQPSTTVTYTGEAKPVGTVLQEVSKSTGLHLRADPSANREIVLVSVKEMPVQSFLNRLASVTSCRWDRNGEELTLQTNEAQRNREAESEMQARTRAVAKQIEEFAKGGMPGFFGTSVTEIKSDSQNGQASEKPPRDPGSEALAGILSRMDPSEIAAVGPGQRLVWATNAATGTQRLLPNGSAELITDWIKGHNATAAKNPAADAEAGGFEQALPKQVLDQIKRESQPVTKAPTKALLVISQSGFMGSMFGAQVTLTAYDNRGNPLISTQTMLTSDLNPIVQDRIASLRSPAQTKPEAPVKSTSIDYSEDSKALLHGFGSMSTSPFSVGTSDLQAKLLHPDLKDPLAYVATDQLLALAKYDDDQIIADLPDDSFGFGMMGSSAATTVEEVQKQLHEGQVLTGAVDGDCLLVRPAKPAAGRRTRIDRPALATLLAAAVSKRQPSLDDVCAYALANEPPFSDPIGLMYCMTFAPSVLGMSLSGGTPDWNMYRFYGSLAPDTRQALKAGGRLGLRELDGAQTGYAEAVLFGPDARYRAPEAAPSGSDMISSMMAMFMGSGGSGTLDPTELMPGGLPGSGYLTCTATDEPVVQMAGSDGKSQSWCFAAGDLAMFDMMKNMPGAGDALSKMPTRGLLGHRSDLAFVFHVAQTGALDRELWDYSIPSDAAQVSLASLPPELQALVEKQRAALKNSPLGMLQSMPMFRQTTPP